MSDGVDECSTESDVPLYVVGELRSVYKYCKFVSCGNSEFAGTEYDVCVSGATDDADDVLYFGQCSQCSAW